MTCQLKPMEPWSRRQLMRVFLERRIFVTYKEADGSSETVSLTCMYRSAKAMMP